MPGTRERPSGPVRIDLRELRTGAVLTRTGGPASAEARGAPAHRARQAARGRRALEAKPGRREARPAKAETASDARKELPSRRAELTGSPGWGKLGFTRVDRTPPDNEAGQAVDE